MQDNFQHTKDSKASYRNKKTLTNISESPQKQSEFINMIIQQLNTIYKLYNMIRLEDTNKTDKLSLNNQYESHFQLILQYMADLQKFGKPKNSDPSIQQNFSLSNRKLRRLEEELSSQRNKISEKQHYIEHLEKENRYLRERISQQIQSIKELQYQYQTLQDIYRKDKERKGQINMNSKKQLQKPTYTSQIEQQLQMEKNYREHTAIIEHNRQKIASLQQIVKKQEETIQTFKHQFQKNNTHLNTNSITMTNLHSQRQLLQFQLHRMSKRAQQLQQRSGHYEHLHTKLITQFVQLQNDYDTIKLRSESASFN